MTNRPPKTPDTESERAEVRVRVFASFEEENEAEHRRLAAMSHQERMREFAVLQARRWGVGWGRAPIAKQATWERLSW
jgi:hypothetical protein